MDEMKPRDFWNVHGIFFLIFITFFPRLTMLFATSAPFGILAWLGWFFFPYLTAAVLATKYYWNTNPILCTIAWFMAFAGTGGEYKIGQETMNHHSNSYDSQKRIEQTLHLEHVKGFEKVVETIG